MGDSSFLASWFSHRAMMGMYILRCCCVALRHLAAKGTVSPLYLTPLTHNSLLVLIVRPFQKIL